MFNVPRGATLDVSKTLSRLFAYLIAMKHRRSNLSEQYAALEAYLITQMREQGLKEARYKDFTIRRTAVPVVSCRSCGHELPTTPGISPEHQPEKLTISQKKAANAA